MNKNSVTTLQKGSHRSLSPVHIHLTDSTPLHVHLKKPVKPKPVYPKSNPVVRSSSRNVKNKNNSNPRNQKVTFDKRKGSPADFDGSYESDEKFDPMEFPTSQKLLMEKDNMLEEFRMRLNESKMENKKLVKNMEEICRGLEERGRDMYGDLTFVDPDLSRLANSQLFLQSIAVKMDDFGTLLRHIKEDRIPSVSNVECDTLLTLKRSLEHDLVTFDDVIIFLRRMMRKMMEEREESGGKSEVWREKYEKLKKDMTDIESRNKETVADLDNHKSEQNQSKTIIESLKTTKAHLQRELTNREAEVNKLTVKVKDLQACLEREKEARERVDQDKENLKKATRLHKNKANQKSESLEQVNKTLTMKEVEVNNLMQQLTSLRLQLSQVATEKLSLAAELNETKLKIIPPMKAQKRNKHVQRDDDEDDIGDDDDDDEDADRSRFKTTSKGMKVKENKNNSDKAYLVQAESKSSQIESETVQLKLKVREFEDLLDDYKEQVSLSRREADKYRSQVEELKLELSRTMFEKEMSKPRQETKLVNENNSAIGNSKILSDRIELLDKRIIILDDENKELSVLNGKREEALNQTNLRLEEKITEISSLQRHLDTLMADMRRMKDSEKDRITVVERSTQIHILELEGQINQLKHDIEKLKREKDEIERRLHQKMYDLQDELKQSHSTNRALQNFIHFLKSSYNATFDQPSLAMFSSIPNLTSMGR